MTFTLNGKPTELPDGATIADVLGRLDLAPDARGIAIAIDAEVVPRGEWPTHVVTEGAYVEIVTAIQGG